MTAICSAQRQKIALAEQQVQYSELVQQNRQLQEQHDNNLRDNFEVTEFLRREIVSKDEKIASLQNKMEEVSSGRSVANFSTSFCTIALHSHAFAEQ